MADKTTIHLLLRAAGSLETARAAPGSAALSLDLRREANRLEKDGAAVPLAQVRKAEELALEAAARVEDVHLRFREAKPAAAAIHALRCHLGEVIAGTAPLGPTKIPAVHAVAVDAVRSLEFLADRLQHHHGHHGMVDYIYSARQRANVLRQMAGLNPGLEPEKAAEAPMAATPPSIHPLPPRDDPAAVLEALAGYLGLVAPGVLGTRLGNLAADAAHGLRNAEQVKRLEPAPADRLDVVKRPAGPWHRPIQKGDVIRDEGHKAMAVFSNWTDSGLAFGRWDGRSYAFSGDVFGIPDELLTKADREKADRQRALMGLPVPNRLAELMMADVAEQEKAAREAAGIMSLKVSIPEPHPHPAEVLAAVARWHDEQAETEKALEASAADGERWMRAESAARRRTTHREAAHILREGFPLAKYLRGQA